MKGPARTVTNDMSLSSLTIKSIFVFKLLPLFKKWAETEQLVQQLTMEGGMIQGFNPGDGKIFCTCPD